LDRYESAWRKNRKSHTNPRGLAAGSEGVPKRKTETETEKEEARSSGPKPSDLKDLWNARATRLPKCLELSKAREARARSRLNDRTLEEWAEVIDKINTTPFLLGENDRGWRADFDWLLKPDSAAKVLEGKYSGTAKQAATPTVRKIYG
jgi:hypothetical protein